MRLRRAVAALVVVAIGACSPSPPPSSSPGPAESAVPTPTPVGQASGAPSPVVPTPSGDIPELADLQGIDWIATSVVGLTPDHAVAPTIRFDGNRIGGSAGCNRYGVDVIIDGGSFQVGSEMVLTAMLCHGEVAELESTFLHALGQADSIRLRGDGAELVISGPGGELVFTRGFTN